MIMQHFLSRCALLSGGAVFLFALTVLSVAFGADDDPFGQSRDVFRSRGGKDPFDGTPPAQRSKTRAAEDGNGAPSFSGWEERIRNALGKPITLRFKDAPLEDVMEFVEQQSGIPTVLIDHRALEDVGIGSDTPITCDLKGITLQSALRLILRNLDLTYVLCDGALVVTTPEVASNKLTVKFFAALDLIRPHRDAPPDDDTITQLIISVVQPQTWADSGGPGWIEAFRGTLVVWQTPEVLDEIPELLATLRKARQIAREHATSPPPVTSLRLFPPRDRKYEAALDRKGNCEFRETCLHDVVDYVKSTWNIETQIDNRALADYGLASDTPITFSAKDLTLRQTLRHMLGELDLTFVLRNEVLLITTPEEAEVQLDTRLYPVGDLVSGVLSPPHHDRVSFQHADYDPLIDLTVSTVATTTWVSVGGSGSMEAWPESGLLVVSQTPAVHAEIEELFAKVRKAIPAEEIAVQRADRDRLRLVVYFVTTQPVIDSMNRRKPAKPRKGEFSARDSDTSLAERGSSTTGAPAAKAYYKDEQLLKLIQALVEPDSWKGEGVHASAAAGRLVIRQTDQVHRKIRRTLMQLGVDFDNGEQLHESGSRHSSGGTDGGGGIF